MFALRTDDLTSDLLAKPRWWKVCHFKNGTFRDADVRRREDLEVHTDELAQHLGHPPRLWCDMTKDRDGYYYPDDIVLFPVNIDKNGNETRLECPRMPNEPIIKWYPALRPELFYKPVRTRTSAGNFLYNLQSLDGFATAPQMSPTPEHYLRFTCDGFWVWSTRR